ncbi:hypothetical protein BGZ98_008144 [Dissophora globulifera]|nr:hypothetical protein BGZ98_008144 [Dissophora globulifera]
MAFQGTITNAQGAVETCTRCQLSIGTQSGTRKHLKRPNSKIAEGCGVLENDVGSENGEVEEGGASNNEPRTKKAKLRLETELAAAQQQIVKDTTKILPLEMVKFVTAAMDVTPFFISENHAIAGTGFTVFLERNYAPLLSAMLQPGFSITHLDLDSSSRHLSPKDGYEEIGSDHITAVESGGPAELERLSRALIVKWSKIAKILCLEVCGRDVAADPHAESLIAVPSSVPTGSPSTQYEGSLKVVVLLDIFRNKRLVIGVRDSNYLVIALELENRLKLVLLDVPSFPSTTRTHTI